jgi:hypothetical protein
MTVYHILLAKIRRANFACTYTQSDVYLPYASHTNHPHTLNLLLEAVVGEDKGRRSTMSPTIYLDFVVVHFLKSTSSSTPLIITM